MKPTNKKRTVKVNYKITKDENKYDLGKVLVTVLLKSGEKFNIKHEGNYKIVQNSVNLITGKISKKLDKSKNVMSMALIQPVNAISVLTQYNKDFHIFKKSQGTDRTADSSFLNSSVLIFKEDIKNITAEYSTNNVYVKEHILEKLDD